MGRCIYGEAQLDSGCVLEAAPSPRMGQCLTLLPAQTIPGLCLFTVFLLPQLAYSRQDPSGVEIREGSQP